VAILTRDEIIAAVDLVAEEVEVPQWGGSVLVKPLTAKQRGQLISSIVEQRKTGNILRLEDIQIRTCAMSIVDEAGKRLFSDADMRMLAGKSSAALQIVSDVAQRLSGLSDEQVEELQGNSEETPSEDSLSD
jgi:hypothetical protein